MAKSNKTKISAIGETGRAKEGAAVSSTAERIIENTRSALNQSQSSSIDDKDQPKLKEKVAYDKVLKEIERLYSPENFKPLMKAPNDVMLALTGNNDIWNITDNEVSAMAQSASISAKYFMATDPKYVALSMFFMSVLTIYGTRAGLQVKDYLNSKRKKENTRPN